MVLLVNQKILGPGFQIALISAGFIYSESGDRGIPDISLLYIKPNCQGLTIRLFL